MKTLTNPSPATPVRAPVPTTVRITVTVAFLLAAVSAVEGATRHWNGSYSIYWSAPLNWDEGVAPVDGDYLVFPAGASRLANYNNIPGLNLQSIQFTGGGYTLQGNSLGLDGFIQVTVSGVANTVDLDVNLDDSLLLAVGYATSSLDINGNLNLGSYTLSIAGGGPIDLSGVISGTGGLSKDGTCVLTLSGSAENTFSGETSVLVGTMQLAKTVTDGAINSGPLTIGDGSGADDTAIVRELDDYQIGIIPITINEDGWLDVGDYYDTVGAITFNGGRAGGSASGTLALGGTVTVNASSSEALLDGHVHMGSGTRTFNVDNGSVGYDLRVSAVVSGGGLTKSGSGLMALLGVNTHTGITTVNAGRLYVLNNDGLGSTSSGTVIGSSGFIQLVNANIGPEALTLGRTDSGSVLYATGNCSWSGDVVLNEHSSMGTSGSMEFSGAISGSGGITTSSGGTFTFSGTTTNTYAGDTHVNDGTLFLNKQSTDGALPGPGDLYVGDGVSSPNSIIVQWLHDFQLDEDVTIHVIPGGTIDLNDHSDTVGSVVMEAGRIYTGTGSMNLTGNVTAQSVVGIGYSQIYDRLSLGTSTRTFTVPFVNGGAWPGLIVHANVSGTGGVTKAGDGGLGLRGDNSYSGTTTVNDGELVVLSDTALGSTSAGTIVEVGTVLSVAGIYPTSIHVGNEALTLSGYLAAGGSGFSTTNSWAGPITLAVDSFMSIHTDVLLDLTGPIDGPGGFTKTRSGTLILSGSSSNTYTGDTVVEEGVLQLSKSGLVEAISAGSLTIGDGDGGAWVDIVRETFNHQIGNVPVRINDSGLLDLNNNLDYLAEITFDGGRVATGSGQVGLAGDVTVLYNDVRAARMDGRVWLPTVREFNVDNTIIYYPDLAMYATVEGPGGIDKTGNGSLILYGANTYEGKTLVSEGVLGIYDSDALGDVATGTSVESGAALIVNANSHVGDESLRLSGTGSGVYSALDSFIGSNSWAGDIVIALDTQIRVLDATDVLNLTGSISGSAGLTKVGNGVLILSGSSGNTYTGNTYVRQGTLELAKTSMDGAVAGQLVIGDSVGGAEADVVRLRRSNQIANTADVTIASSGLFDLDGYYDRVDGVTGSGSVALGSGHLVAGNNNSSFTFDGLASGSGYLWKVGTGTWTLTGDNTYSGITRIETGTLIVNGFQPDSDVRVQTAGTLGGVGTVGEIDSQGMVAPGSSPGQLRSGNVGLSSASAFAVELHGHLMGSGYDQLNLKGTVDVTGAILDATLGYLPAVGDSFVILNNDFTDPVTGTFAGLPDGDSITVSNATLVIDYHGGDGNDIELTVTNVTAVEALRIGSIEEVGGDVELTWAGGVPFYVVEKKAGLTNDAWLPVTPSMRETQTNLPMDSPQGFYRVHGGN